MCKTRSGRTDRSDNEWILKCPHCKKFFILEQRIDVGKLRKPESKRVSISQRDGS